MPRRGDGTCAPEKRNQLSLHCGLFLCIVSWCLLHLMPVVVPASRVRSACVPCASRVHPACVPRASRLRFSCVPRAFRSPGAAARPGEQLAWAPLGVRGRVYVATEGVNAQMAVPCTSTERFERAVEAVEKLAGV